LLDSISTGWPAKINVDFSRPEGAMSEQNQSVASLAQLALRAYEDAQRELAEYEARLHRTLGAKPGPKTVGEREIESATAEAIGIGITANDWQRGSLATSRS
jgi:hypothetical protein